MMRRHRHGNDGKEEETEKERKGRKEEQEQLGEEEEGEEQEEEEEEDYLSMTIVEPEKPKWRKETYSEIRRRKEREAEEKGRQKSKKELAAEAATRFNDALSTPLPSSTSKGAAMMAKLGYRPGQSLGVSGGGGRTEPLELSVKDDRGGIGLDTERKRKFREQVAMEAEEAEKKRKLEEEKGVGYRERVAMERDERRMEAVWMGCMRVAEELDEELGGDGDGDGDKQQWEGSPTEEERRRRTKGRRRGKKKKKTNVLWRTLERNRKEKEQERLAQKALLSRRPSNIRNLTGEDDEDEEEVLFGGGDTAEDLVDLDLGEDDELDAFLELPARERLERLVRYLRETWRYCFWCKFRYPDEQMDGCPGEEEEDHD